MKKKNYYNILGVPKGATQDEIRASYRALAMRYHPDRNPESPNATQKFHDIVEAYEVLSDRLQRRQYDQMGALFRIDGRPPEREDLSAFFSETFSKIFQRSKKQKGKDIQIQLSISLERVYQGGEETLDILRECRCPLCLGSKAAKDGTQTCPNCNGTGKNPSSIIARRCKRCDGTGSIIIKRCKRCGGTGRVDRKETITLEIPRGIHAGQKLRIRNRGHEGFPYDNNGDLFVEIQMDKHPFFERRGNDLFCDIPILWLEATIGASITVPTLNGTAYIRVPKSTPSHTILRLREKGLPDRAKNTFGDIHYRIIIEIPQLKAHEELKIRSFFSDLSTSAHPHTSSFRQSLPTQE